MKKTDKKTSSVQSTLAAFKTSIRLAAKDNDVPQSAVTPVMFWGSARDIAEWDVRRLGGFSALKKQLFPFRPEEDDVSAFWLKSDNAKDNKDLKLATRDEAFFKSLEKYSDRVFSGKMKPAVVKSSGRATDRVITAVLSDLHFGSDIKREETGHNYQKIEESRRLAKVVSEIANYKIQYRDRTDLELLILGDVIQNQLHSPMDGAVLAEQCARAIHLLSQAVGVLAGSFKKIRVRCATGNHGRNTARHQSRAVDQKWDSIETIIYYAVKKACAALKNVEFFIPKTPYGTYSVFGSNILYTHGDGAINPGNPGKAIAIGSLENQTNRINASLPDHGEYSVFIVGHVHTASSTHLGNGAVMLTNGALCPPDQFATTIGIFESSAGQYVFESIKGFPFGDSRFIRVNSDTDKDKSLDSVIKPWKSFEE
jgi:hypothetical protein